MTFASKTSIPLSSGKYFDFLDPDNSEITLPEIAHALSNIGRFTGHTKFFYSVAQHSVLVSRLVPLQYAMWGLFHDAAEAVMGDVSTPLKKLLPDYMHLEYTVERSIFNKLGLEGSTPECVKHADKVALATEKRDLLPIFGPDWRCLEGIEAYSQAVLPMSPRDAELVFLTRYWEIRQQVQIQETFSAMHHFNLQQ